MKAKSFFATLIVLIILGVIVAFAFLDASSPVTEEEINRQSKLRDQAYETLVANLEADTGEYDYTVLINPVLGGIEIGDTVEGVNESDIVLSVARYVRDHNIDESIRIVLTRDSDTNPTDLQRQAIADMVNPDIIIELETSLDTDTSKLGVIVNYDDSFYNYKLTNVDLADAVLRGIVNHTFTKVDGLYSGYKSIFNKSIPTVSVGIGYISNKEERQALNSEAYRENIALGILEGMQEIL